MAFVLMGLVSAGDALLLARLEGQAPTTAAILVRTVPRWGVWALLAPAVVWLVRRGSPEARGTVQALAAQVPLLLVVLGVQLTLSSALAAGIVSAALPGAPPPQRVALMYATSQLQVSILIYGVIVVSVWAWDWRGRLRARLLTEAALERQLAEARLSALRYHLNPHFLFNTLQTVSDLVPEDPRAAVRVVALLGDVLRGTLDARGQTTVPLGQEIRTLEPYLEIERVRFQDRLEVEVDVPPDLVDLPVPEFVLQPLVENAVRHGIARRSGTGRIRIAARRQGTSALLTVEDTTRAPVADFPGGAESMHVTDPVDGIGLGVTRARLGTLYGDAAGITLRPRPNGMMAEVRVPLLASACQT